MGTDYPARTRRRVEHEVARLAGLVGLPQERWPGFVDRDAGYPFLRIGDAGEYRYLAYERGRLLFEQVTSDLDELLYWAFRDAAHEAAGRWASRNRLDGEPFRVTLWRRQFELLHTLRPAWAGRRRAELIASLPDRDEGIVPPLPGADC
jgi:hypothetical protein